MLKVLSGLSRDARAVLGGYGLTALLVALLATILKQAGLPRSEAVAGFLIYLAVLVWAFSAVRLRTLWAGLGGGGQIAR